MSFATYEFAFFGLVAVSLFWALRNHRREQKLVMLAASYLAYARFDLRLMALLAGSSVLNFGLGELIVRSERDRVRTAWTTVGVVANLLFLGWFKYYDFFRSGLESASATLGLSAHLPILEVLLPLGISFYTFQSVAYLIDLKRGTGVRAPSLLDYLLFIAFFPQLVAGPICRSRDLLPQLAQPAPKNVPSASEAITLIGSGLFKKLVISTLLSTRIVEDAFIRPEEFAGVDLFVAAIAYSIQLYCDFSGYTDIARGTSLLCGLRLPENFNAPYAATSPGDFWERWHITFSRWLRDYLYIPLGGSRRGLPRTCINLMITFTLSGLWHGAKAGYLIWGALHGVALCGQKVWRERQRTLGIDPKEQQTPAAKLILFWFLTFMFVVFSRVPFRAPDLETTWLFFRQMLTLAPGNHLADGVVIFAIVLGLLVNFGGGSLRSAVISLHKRVPWAFRPVLWTAIAVAILAIKPTDVAPFIYFQF